jgi:hypothetical protein
MCMAWHAMCMAWNHVHCIESCALHGLMQCALNHAHCMGSCTLHGKDGGMHIDMGMHIHNEAHDAWKYACSYHSSFCKNVFVF